MTPGTVSPLNRSFPVWPRQLELRTDGKIEDFILTGKNKPKKLRHVTNLSHLCLILSKKPIASTVMSSVPAGAINVKEHLAADS